MIHLNLYVDPIIMMCLSPSGCRIPRDSSQGRESRELRENSMCRTIIGSIHRPVEREAEVS